MSFEGIILLDKPEGFTSFDVIAKLRGITKTKKIGHGGTLDPMATGLLPIFFGRATKACDIFPIQDKSYRATVKLGLTTDTQDITGTVLTTSNTIATMEQVREILPKYTGIQQQLPPMYSAVSVGGQRLYDLARQGIEVERASREINIYSITFIEGSGDTFIIDVDSSKGTYIRTLCHDIGQALGCGATLSGLRRTKACGFDLSEAITLEEAQSLMDNGELQEKLTPIAEIFHSLPKLQLNEKDTAHYLNGVKFTAKRFGVNSETGDVSVYGSDGDFLGISYVDSEGMLQCKKQFKIL